MKVTWYKTASLLLETPELRIVFDPYLQFPKPDKKLLVPFRSAQIVFITHGHFDHIADIPKIYENLPVRIYGTEAPLARLVKKGMPSDKLRHIAPGYIRSFGDVKVTAYAGRHCRFDRTLIQETAGNWEFFRDPKALAQLLRMNLQYQEKDETLFYECRQGEKRLQIMGSLALRDEVKYPTGADLLILPFQGRSDLNEYAMQFVERLQPKAVCLDHYDDAFPPITRGISTWEFETAVADRFGIPCSAMRCGQAVEI